MDLNELKNLDGGREYERPEEGDQCPRCDGALVRRYRRDEEGKEFLGCNNFPRCEFTQNL